LAARFAPCRPRPCGLRAPGEGRRWRRVAVRNRRGPMLAQRAWLWKSMAVGTAVAAALTRGAIAGWPLPATPFAPTHSGMPEWGPVAWVPLRVAEQDVLSALPQVVARIHAAIEEAG
jgi:hypothetical protein